jgi:short-subunit dehydrogenase
MATLRSKGKVAVITGASSGIGRAAARLLAAEGASLVLCARNRAALEELGHELRPQGDDLLVCPADLAHPRDAAMLIGRTIDRFHRIDYLVCSAGQYVRGPVLEQKLETLEEALRVNFLGTVAVILETLPHMLKMKSGAIVAVTSVDGKKGLPLDAPYVASKFAMTGYMDVLRQELRGTGIHGVTILPGRVDTPMIDTLRVPLISRKISAERVGRTIVRALHSRRSTEIIVPYFGPTLLVLLGTLAPRLADVLVRVFRLEGTRQEVSSRA